MSYNKKDLNDKFISFLDQVKDEEHRPVTHLNDRVLIIDGLNTFIRAFAVNPSINDDGLHIGGMIGFLRSIRYTCDILKPSRCIIVFDGKNGSKRRSKIYPEYKATRKVKKRLNRNVDWGTAPADEEESMKQQMGRLIEYLEQLPLTLVCIDGIEADDTIAYISQQVLPKSDTFIMSTDKDFLQLVDERVKVWSPTKKKLYTKQEILEEYGIPSKNILTYRILDGDKSDNITGIRGAGIKSIIKYCPQITTDRKFDVMDLLDFVNNSDSKIKLLENIKNSSKLVKRNYLLMQLSKVDIPNHTKMKIQGAVNGDVPQLIKYKFQTMFLKDKLSTQIKDLDSWIMEFVRLDRFRGLSGK
jgi:5'-3' exonuclease